MKIGQVGIMPENAKKEIWVKGKATIWKWETVTKRR
jgi:hypothetical protein